MNDTLGENGLMPLRHFFGIILRFPILSSNLPSQNERMDALKAVQGEMNSIVLERRVLEVLAKIIPAAADQRYMLGYKVLLFSEVKRE